MKRQGIIIGTSKERTRGRPGNGTYNAMITSIVRIETDNPSFSYTLLAPVKFQSLGLFFIVGTVGSGSPPLGNLKVISTARLLDPLREIVPYVICKS